MPAVGQGAQTAIQECQYQFKSNRWNCSTPYGSGIVGPIHKLGTREAAFTYAILSAGVTHEIGRRCKQGLLASCGCSDEAKPKNVADDWTWGGCGDNVDYGYRFAKSDIHTSFHFNSSTKFPAR
ncbi:wnt family protein [Teladorsagia circumcincta]|uniref:Protein Wnt n=1 Tax=Teladorsagia circumcincta TaxID=45464 RepID=A0A2G9U8R0_TELCI|nr:wnt family protein [Teladorsagia circumcincta]